MDDLAFTVKYTYYPPFRGYRNSLFVPEEPDEPEEIIIHEIVDEYGSTLILPDIYLEVIEKHILNHIKNWLDGVQ